MNKKILEELFGWYGTTAIVGAYACLSFGLLTSDSLLFQILNGTGAVGIAYISFKKKAYQPAVLNSIWTIIAVVGIVMILL